MHLPTYMYRYTWLIPWKITEITFAEKRKKRLSPEPKTAGNFAEILPTNCRKFLFKKYQIVFKIGSSKSSN